MSMSPAKTPNPGSDDAVKQGCICPVMDNAHGVGCGYRDKNGNPCFWITEGCPLHSKKETAKMPEYKTDDLMANVRTHIPDFDMATEIMRRIKRADLVRGNVDVEALKRDILKAIDERPYGHGRVNKQAALWTIDQLAANGWLNGGWKTIDSAPTDRMIDLYGFYSWGDGCSEEPSVHEAHWYKSYGGMWLIHETQDGFVTVHAPTHWRERPQPPEAV